MARTLRGKRARIATGCRVTGKTSFRSTDSARRFLERLDDDWNGETARVYRCQFCDWIHLTSQRTGFEVRRSAA